MTASGNSPVNNQPLAELDPEIAEVLAGDVRSHE